MPGERQTPTVRLRRLAAELRLLRTSSGLTRDEIVERTGINVATLYRIEHARVRPQTRTLRTLLARYGVEGAHQGELIALLRDARQRGWLHAYQAVLPEQYTTYIGFEGEARGAWNYESLYVPGLVQTEDYARAVIRGGFPSASRDEIERRVQVGRGGHSGCGLYRQHGRRAFLEEESDVRRHKLVFEHLRAVADSPDAARSVIAGLVAQT
jgi:transcriptional regulator with XRE-family HTH domain